MVQSLLFPMPVSLDNLRTVTTPQVQHPAQPDEENHVWVQRPPRHGYGIRRNLRWSRTRPSRSRPGGPMFRNQRSTE